MQATRSTNPIMNNLRSSLNSGVASNSTTSTYNPDPNLQQKDAHDLLTTSQKLDVLDGVLTKIESGQNSQGSDDSLNANLAVGADKLINQQQLNQTGSTGLKEGARVGAASTEQGSGPAQAEAGKSVQYIESPPSSPEISPEVSEYLQRVDDDKEKYPKEVVLADEKKIEEMQKSGISDDVVVIPMTADLEKKSKGKNTKLSVTWLIHWCNKIKEMIVGRVVYAKKAGKKN